MGSVLVGWAKCQGVMGAEVGSRGQGHAGMERYQAVRCADRMLKGQRRG